MKSGKRNACHDQEIAVAVTMPGKSLVQISMLAGMDYYDAVVRIDNIVAVKMQMRCHAS